MHEDLLGYLLGALEPHEMQRVGQWLREDPEARRELAEVERMLGVFEQTLDDPVLGDPADAVVKPADDLVSRTMANLPPLPPPAQSTALVQPPNVEEPVQAQLVPMRSNLDPPRSATLTWMDWAGGAASIAVVLALLLPAIAEGRFESRKSACQDQLRHLGTAITQYVMRNEQSRLPAVAQSGPEAFAGVYTIRLREAGLLEDATIRWCPSLDMPEQAQLAQMGELPSVSQLHESSVDRLRQVQRFAGGHYAYTLGVIDGDRFASPRYESRSSFAVMSDAPMSGNPSSDKLLSTIGHSQQGINLLYEDGRVQFVSASSLGSMPDHPLLNHRGQAEAGVNVDDASLAPSWRPPFVEVSQR